MPIAIGQIDSRVNVAAGDGQLSEAETERIVALVLARLDARLRDRERVDAAARIQADLLPPETYE